MLLSQVITFDWSLRVLIVNPVEMKVTIRNLVFDGKMAQFILYWCIVWNNKTPRASRKTYK